jgi:hypothetical protein
MTSDRRCHRKNLGETLGVHDYGFFFFGLPPFLPLILACSFPASVVGPVDGPPCHLQRPDQ